jgi:hypothetical protein
MPSQRWLLILIAAVAALLVHVAWSPWAHAQTLTGQVISHAEADYAGQM